MPYAFLSSSTIQPPPLLVDVFTNLGEVLAGMTPVVLLVFLLFTAFAIVAIATAKPNERSKAALRVLELLMRTKHPPG